MKTRLSFITLIFYVALESDAVGNSDRDVLQRIADLNPAHQQVVINYIHKNEKLGGELKVVADIRRIAVRSSPLLEALFPAYRFVSIPWKYEPSPAAASKFSIPDGMFDTLALSIYRNRVFVFHSSGNAEAYGDFLCAEHTRVVTEEQAASVTRAFSEIYGTGMGSEVRRRGDSEWLLGYREYPFRAVSSYEGVREASYYRLETDSSGLVLRGRLVTDTLERRKIR